ncbi:hypothetical protein B0E42_28670 [Pseudomonas sp. A25(2017)]|uniref:hypothetical protein n=1 Tax=Pseudomonas sp. A25(2017) TaxID=1945865 RepID=UPI0009846E2E|nr:hypothetical protein [Pseudomonas sp. A25(2017)]OOG79913.1 hypothetical protein B0E42_28670 [Pseudomonas sp. A25(2017)]
MTTKPCAQASRAEYTRRMNRMLNYIDAHLDHSLDGAQLADAMRRHTLSEAAGALGKIGNTVFAVMTGRFWPKATRYSGRS